MKRVGGIAAIVLVAAWSCLGQEKGPASAPSKPSTASKPAGGWWDDVFAERDVALSKILATPEAWRNTPVSFVVQFHQLTKAAPSFFTRFEPDAWLGFSAWADEAALWEKKAFELDFGHLFVRRNGADFQTVSKAAIYDRLTISGIVRDVIKGKPWIEVTSVRTLSEKMNEASLVHLVKGLTLRDLRRFDAAAREFESADADTLPVSVRLVGMREHAYALLNSRRPKAAEERMLTAMALDPENTEIAVALTHVRDVGKGMPPERRPAASGDQPATEDGEPAAPNPAEATAEAPRRGIQFPLPKRAPTDTRPTNPTTTVPQAGPLKAGQR